MMLILTKKKFCAIMDAVRVHFEEFGGLLRDKEGCTMYLTLTEFILLTELLLRVVEIEIMCYYFFRNKKR